MKCYKQSIPLFYICITTKKNKNWFVSIHCRRNLSKIGPTSFVKMTKLDKVPDPAHRLYDILVDDEWI